MKIDFSQVKERELDTGLQVFFKLISISGPLGEVKTNKSTLAQELGKTRACIANHINRLVKAGVMKYKYNGSGWLNPAVIFKGADVEYSLAIELYRAFKSDVT